VRVGGKRPSRPKNAAGDWRTAAKSATLTAARSEENRNRGDRVVHVLTALALAAVTMGVYGTIAAGLVTGSRDYRLHILFAKALHETGNLPAPHFLLHALIAGLFAARLAPSLDAACRMLLASCYGATALILYGAFWSAFRRSWIGRPLGVFLLSLAVLLAEPITLSHAYQLGYLWIESYVIPTSTLLKPFALAVFFLTVWCFSGREIRTGTVATLALATVVGALSKPSFLICALPAVAVLCVFRLCRKVFVSWRALLLGLYIPSIAVLGWQFYESYSGAGTAVTYHDSIIWAPLKVMSFYAKDILPKLLLSILFPLTVTAVCWRHARRNTVLQLGWIVFLFGAAYTYLLAEKVHWPAANFLWSGYIATFVLFAASVLVFGEVLEAKSSARWRVLLCGTVLALHVASGARLDWLYLTHYGCPQDFREGEFACAERPRSTARAH
jgi:hypothetical protein